ncbi:hypothetical protein RRG08_000861 [Elysia crispata]|nr:hypothetical protein RRG08_000861 [Elysia crispata]
MLVSDKYIRVLVASQEIQKDTTIATYSDEILTDKTDIREQWKEEFPMLYFYHVYKSEERIALPSDELVNLDRAFTEETSNAKFDVRNDRVDLVSTRIISKDSIINVYSGPSTIHMWEDGQWVQYWSLTPTNLYNESADFNPYDRHNNVQNGCKDNECGTVYNVKSSEFEFICECFKYHVVCDNDIGCMCDPKICANRPFDTQLDKKTIVAYSTI